MGGDDRVTVPGSIDELGEVARQLFNDKNLEVSKLRPFFWSLVETYVDRFQLYPFDVTKALFSHLELNGYPEDELRTLINQLETLYKKNHGQPVNATPALDHEVISLDDEVANLRDCIKYAVLVSER